MAMTKAEKAEMERLAAELRLARALRWSGHQAPEMIPAPVYGQPATSGWVMSSYAEGRAEEAWSESSAHGWGKAREPGRSAVQGGIALYATRRDALIALRIAKEREAAKLLARLDDMIAEATD